LKTLLNNNKNITEDNDDAEESAALSKHQIILLPSPDNNHPQVDTRLVGLYGQIDEEKCRDVVAGLYYLKELGKVETESEKDNEESTISYKPIKFLISTEGGLVADMFSVYDVMRDIQQECEIETIGVGKVMSAGVLLLAAGTKGKRRVGRNCRIMIHQITGGVYGHLEDQENNYKETLWTQETYIKELCRLSKLTKKKVDALFKKKIDVYFDAEQAVAWGIADEIF